MSYHLTVIANKKDPEERSGRPPRKTPTVSTLVLTGALRAEATAAILAAVGEVSSSGVDSIIVEFDDVTIEQSSELAALVAGLMGFRQDGINVQVFAPSDELFEELAKHPKSRDWLLWRSANEITLPRKALHVDHEGPCNE